MAYDTDQITVVRGVAVAGQTGRYDLEIVQGLIASMTSVPEGHGGLILPLMADAHVHLDKTLTQGRLHGRPNTLFEAIELAQSDKVNWTREDLRARATSALKKAYAHGTGVMRSHVDWVEPGVPLPWEILTELREEWRGRVELQLAALMPLDLVPEAGAAVAKRVAADGGVLGAFVYRNDMLVTKVSQLFDLAEQHDLDLDFHVDEGLDPEAQGIDVIIAETAQRAYSGRVLCGHGCALSVRPKQVVQDLLERAARAGVALCVLPTTNSYLQDATPGRTPRLRGIAPLHEARAAGVEVLLASDNCRDAFYPHGDYDLMDVYRFAVLAGRLDAGSWLSSITTIPARICGQATEISPGASADFIHYDATDIDDIISRPRVARTVWRQGRPLSADPEGETK